MKRAERHFTLPPSLSLPPHLAQLRQETRWPAIHPLGKAEVCSELPASPALWDAIKEVHVFPPHYFLNYESMITLLQETWKMPNKVTYSPTTYYNNFLVSRLRFFSWSFNIKSQNLTE